MPNSWRKSTSNNADDNSIPIGNNPFQSISNILKNTIQRVLSLSIKTAPIVLPIVFIIIYGPTLITQVPKLGTLILSRLPIPPKSNKSDTFKGSKQSTIIKTNTIIKPNKQSNNSKKPPTSSYKQYTSSLFSSPSTIREPKPENDYIQTGTKAGSGSLGKLGFGRSAGAGGGSSTSTSSNSSGGGAGGKIDRYALDKASKLNIFERILLLKDIIMGN